MSTRIPPLRPPAQEEPPSMRKEPRQVRSRVTVDAIIRAGARVLGDRGLDGFTTNEAAAVAGVSIGSLYQYFPDKLSLIDAIRRRHLDDVLAVMRETGQGNRPFAQLVEGLVDGMIAVHSIQPALHRVLLDEAPRYDGSRSIHGLFESEYMDRYKAIITASRNRNGRAAVEIAAQVLSSAVEGVIHNAARRGTLTSPELRQGLVHLICSYLGSSDDWRGRA
jgi:AcrR family transcriptional regulator